MSDTRTPEVYRSDCPQCGRRVTVCPAPDGTWHLVQHLGSYDADGTAVQCELSRQTVPDPREVETPEGLPMVVQAALVSGEVCGRIDEFEAQCAREGYVDAGGVRTLLSWIRARLRAVFSPVGDHDAHHPDAWDVLSVPDEPTPGGGS